MPKPIAALSVFAALCAACSLGPRSAWALDGYADRRGLFVGVVAGGGTLRGGGQDVNGGRVGARVGGGTSQGLTADLTLDYGGYSGTDRRFLTATLAANVHLLDLGRERAPAAGGPLVRLGGAVLRATRPGAVGFQAVAGAGYEVFLGGDLAGSFTLTYEPVFLARVAHGVFGTVALHWY